MAGKEEGEKPGNELGDDDFLQEWLRFVERGGAKEKGEEKKVC